MTGPEHYREAERLIEIARDTQGIDAGTVSRYLAAAQAHATLALAAATAANDPDPTGTGQPTAVAAEWFDVISPTESA